MEWNGMLLRAGVFPVIRVLRDGGAVDVDAAQSRWTVGSRGD